MRKRLIPFFPALIGSAAASAAAFALAVLTAEQKRAETVKSPEEDPAV